LLVGRVYYTTLEAGSDTRLLTNRAGEAYTEIRLRKQRNGRGEQTNLRGKRIMVIRRSGILLLLAALVTLLVACDAKGLPDNPTAQPTVAAQATRTTQPTVPRSTPTSGEVEGTPTTPTRNTAEAQATTTVTPGGLSNTDLEVIEIENNAEKVRGLAPKKDVPETFIDKDQMRANMTKLFEEEYSREEAQQDATELWLLRLLDDPKMDLYQLQLDLHSDVVLGYYEPKKDSLFVLKEGDILSAQSRSTIAHEFVHSLQDEYYDLDKLLPEDSVEYDRDLAVRALVEGDAVTSEDEFEERFFTPDEKRELEEQENSGDISVLLRTPRYILLTLYFPYLQGHEFAKGLRDLGGFEKINAALADPPQSSEQILHPEKYLNTPRDEPVKVTIPPLTSTLTTLGPDWKYMDGGSFGEFDLQLLLKINGFGNSQSDQAAADSAAAGWGGGWYVHYQSGDTSVLALDTRWDTTDDANEFNAAMGKSFRGVSKQDNLWVQGGRYFSVVQSDKRVLYLCATDRKALEAVSNALK
jgi:hypothetical protein